MTDIEADDTASLSYYDNLTHKYNIYVDIVSWVATFPPTFLILKDSWNCEDKRK